MARASDTIQLQIGPVIGRADELAAKVREELPTHDGLAAAASGVAKSAREAERVARRLRRPWGLHRLPVLFLTGMLLWLVLWSYWRFFHVSTLSLALPARDAVALHARVSEGSRVRLKVVETVGSRESVELLNQGKVDLAFVQGGIPFPSDLPRVEMPETETLLFFLREGVSGPREVRRILTSTENQGSHSVLTEFVKLWGINDQVTYLHQWRELTADPNYVIPADVDAAFIIKDLTSDDSLIGIERVTAAGFRLADPAIGSRYARLKYLRSTQLPAGFLLGNPPVPAEPVNTFTVVGYLVTRRNLTPRQFAEAAHLLDREANTLAERGFEPTWQESKEIFEGIESFLSILVYIGLAFLALLGVEVYTYRRRFNELNTLVSLLSMHQSNKDVLGLADDARRKENLLYLSLCSDLLGLISVITGYYSQENPSLLYNKLLEIIHHRSSGLKLNIQLKILHAAVPVSKT